MNELKLKTKSNEVKDNGIVVIAVSAFGNKDSDGDVLLRGAFTKTLNENNGRFKHLLNHNVDYLIGCPYKAEETNSHLVVESALNLDTELGRNVYSNYKLYQKFNKTLEHSIGYEDVKRNPMHEDEITEAKLWEVSTLYGWGANENTPLLGLKSNDVMDNRKAFEVIREALKMKFSDDILMRYEERLHLLEKAMNGGTHMVECECGLKFDYDSIPERKLTEDINEQVISCIWRSVYEVAESEVRNSQSEIREQVRNLLEKSMKIEDIAYVRCPRCGKIHYRSSVIGDEAPVIIHKLAKQVIVEKPKDVEPSKDTHEEKSRENTFSLKSLGGLK